MISSLLHVLVGLSKIIPLILKKLKEYRLNEQEKILNETDPTSDNSIVDTAKRLHKSKKDS